MHASRFIVLYQGGEYGMRKEEEKEKKKKGSFVKAVSGNQD